MRVLSYRSIAADEHASTTSPRWPSTRTARASACAACHDRPKPLAPAARLARDPAGPRRTFLRDRAGAQPTRLEAAARPPTTSIAPGAGPVLRHTTESPLSMAIENCSLLATGNCTLLRSATALQGCRPDGRHGVRALCGVSEANGVSIAVRSCAHPSIGAGALPGRSSGV